MKGETITIDIKKVYDYFYQAELELKNKNRFCNEKLDNIIEFIFSSDINKIFLKNGTHLFRARIYDYYDGDSKYNDISEKIFKGYDELGSFVNLNFNAILDGRCNPSGIPYLYASNSQRCCIHEVRPSIDAYVNVAEIEISKTLKILDLSTATIACMHPEKNRIFPEIPNGVLCQYLYELFKRPYQHNSDYLITQYISEKIKNCGYDGIRYESSLYRGEMNQNYVIFSYQKCKAINSRLFKIIGNEVLYE